MFAFIEYWDTILSPVRVVDVPPKIRKIRDSLTEQVVVYNSHGEENRYIYAYFGVKLFGQSLNKL